MISIRQYERNTPCPFFPADQLLHYSLLSRSPCSTTCNLDERIHQSLLPLPSSISWFLFCRSQHTTYLNPLCCAIKHAVYALTKKVREMRVRSSRSKNSRKLCMANTDEAYPHDQLDKKKENVRIS